MQIYTILCRFGWAAAALLFALMWSAASSLAQSGRPISLHPDNPHYFLFRDKPTILITSAEHYGAVINLDFDFLPYLDELKSKGLNNTRVFTGTYVEPKGAFNIESNTLAPTANRFIAPWARSLTPGYSGGGNKFDLTKWDAAYFTRLKDFLAEAAKRDIVVEVTLFCPFYEESQWKLSPQNAINNVNNVGGVARTDVYTLGKNGGLLAVHEALVRKIVAELKDFDNIYYEICNEPYFGGVALEWQHKIADIIVDAEKSYPNKHLISQNIANGSVKIENPHPAVSIFNFHYAAPPDAVGLNYNLNKVIGDNETGFRGTSDRAYRVEGWNFIIAGGGLFNNLDYSFTADHEAGTYLYPAKQPGGGGVNFRRQMTILKNFIDSFDFVKMKPNDTVIKGGVPSGWTARALVEANRAYAIYLGPAAQSVNQFSVSWTGQVEPLYSETYTFHTFSNDGVRLWINNQPVIDNWTDHSGREDTGQITLKANQKYDLKLDYYQSGGGAAMKLFWSSSSQKKEIIPLSQLSLPDRSGPGLQGKYHTGKNFELLKLTRTDATVNFDWTDASPFDLPRDEAGTNQVANLLVDLPTGSYKAEWINTKTGGVDKAETFTHAGGNRKLTSPSYVEDIALRIKRT